MTGLIDLPERTVEYDIALLDRYQKFSSELLRISLIGITAIGFVVSHSKFPENETKSFIDMLKKLPTTRGVLVVALISLVVSVGAALAHRYFSSDGMVCHLNAMRLLEKMRYGKGQKGDARRLTTQIEDRDCNFKVSTCSIAISAFALGSGAILLVLAIGMVLSQASS